MGKFASEPLWEYLWSFKILHRYQIGPSCCCSVCLVHQYSLRYLSKSTSPGKSTTLRTGACSHPCSFSERRKLSHSYSQLEKSFQSRPAHSSMFLVDYSHSSKPLRIFFEWQSWHWRSGIGAPNRSHPDVPQFGRQYDFYNSGSYKSYCWLHRRYRSKYLISATSKLTVIDTIFIDSHPNFCNTFHWILLRSLWSPYVLCWRHRSLVYYRLYLAWVYASQCIYSVSSECFNHDW